MNTQRKIVLATHQYYHIYNRGVERRIIFTNKREYDRMLRVIQFYRFADNELKFSKYNVLTNENRREYHQRYMRRERIEMLAYCLMPNHFHFLIKQNLDNGIATFMANIQNSYTRYFNTKHTRVGPLLQGIFRTTWIESDEQLLHVSRYIHLNPIISSLVHEHTLDTYPYSSLSEYLSPSSQVNFCRKDTIMSHFKSSAEYRTFVHDQIDYARKLSWIEYVIIDGNHRNSKHRDI